MSNENPLKRLSEFGQSVWLDNINRDLIESGDLGRLIENDGISGVTTNPSIFEKAISGSDEYDAILTELFKADLSGVDVFNGLAVEDVRDAADILRPVFEQTGGEDGYVSIEVPPNLANDTEASIEAAHKLHKMVDRPNVLIKIPGTKAGLKAIEQLISEGLSINVTLLFSNDRYREVIDAYLSGLERLQNSGGDVSTVFSVASFFISRVDTAVDAALEDLSKKSEDEEMLELLLDLQGTIAVVNARQANQIYTSAFSHRRFADLQAKGARKQKLLWASTSTKNPELSDTLYVDELIGPDTVNTMPEVTIAAYRDHGEPRDSLKEDVETVDQIIDQLPQLGINLAAITKQLELEGVAAFEKSFEALLAVIEEKKASLAALH